MHDVHFVVSVGNHDGVHQAEWYVREPAMALNAIAVGSVMDNNQLIGAYAPASLNPSDQILGHDFDIEFTSCYHSEEGIYKPDLVSFGSGIQYGEFNYSGSSIATPQVAAHIAQLCELHPSMLTNNSGMKAVLAASAVFRTGNTNSTTVPDTKDSYSELFERQGAGIENVCCANAILNGGKTKNITLSGTTHYYTFTINVPSSYTYLRLSVT